MNREAQIRIDLNSPEPAYRQIAAQIRALVVEGALESGDALPPVRRLAVDLGVHFNTVAEAYRQLSQEGFLEVSHGKAARVAERKTPKLDKAVVDVMRQRLRHLIAEMRASGLSADRLRDEFKKLLEGDKP